MNNEALLALELVEDCGFSHRDALEAVLEGDAEKAADKMVAKIKDPKDKEKAKKKFVDQMKQRMEKRKCKR